MPERLRVVVDRPADRLLVDRAEVVTGWIDASASAGGDHEDGLVATCAGRALSVRRCWHPDAPRGAGVGFWTILLIQDVLPYARRGELEIEISWRGVRAETLRLHISPIAEHLAREYPLNIRDYEIPHHDGAAGVSKAPTIVFPGLGAVGGASLNQLLRRKMLREGWAVPVHFEANDADLWARARADDPRLPRWIDGHACYGAAEPLGTPFARVTLLREPATRLLSIFNYNALVHPYDRPFATVDAFLASDAAASCTQAAALLRVAGIAVASDISTDELYARAREELRRHYALVGVTELFEETIFLLCQLGGYDTIGMWWRVLSAPGRRDESSLGSDSRHRLESLIGADRRLYDDARRDLLALIDARELALLIAPYRADAAAAAELPDALKLVECLRWRQILTEAELRAVRAAAATR